MKVVVSGLGSLDSSPSFPWKILWSRELSFSSFFRPPFHWKTFQKTSGIDSIRPKIGKKKRGKTRLFFYIFTQRRALPAVAVFSIA